MEIGVKEAKRIWGSLLDRVKDGEEVIITRRGKQVARLVPVDTEKEVLPNQKEFRASIHVSGKPMSEEIAEQRSEERY
jgi:prevent-host-death family protein